VILTDPLLRDHVTEHVASLLVGSAHSVAPFARSGSMVVRGDHDVDPPRVTFSSAC
jgi:hypothetical protein